MEAHDYWKALVKSWALILVLVVVGGAAAAAYAFSRPDSYEATSEVFVSTPQGSTTDQLSQGSQFTQNLVASYTKLASSPKVLSPVISQLGLDTTPERLATHVATANPLDTVIVQITVTESNPDQAASIANAIADSLRTVTVELSPTSSTGSPQVSMTVIATAAAPTAPSGPNRLLLIVSGLVAGLLIGIVVAVIRTAVDTRLRDVRDVEQASAAPAVGTVRRAADDAAALVVTPDTTSPLAEDYRRVGATLEFAAPDGTKTLLLAPVSAGATSTEVTLNVAAAAAERGRRVVIVDADLRGRQITTLTGVDSSRGLSEVLSGSVAPLAAVVEWKGVSVLPAGATQSNPHFALGKTALATTLAALADTFDLVVVDAPAFREFADALTLSHAVDATVLVASARSTRRADLTAAVEQLEAVESVVAGVVLTEVGGRPAAEPSAPRHDAAAAAPTSPVDAPAVDATESATDADADPTADTDTDGDATADAPAPRPTAPRTTPSRPTTSSRPKR